MPDGTRDARVFTDPDRVLRAVPVKVALGVMGNPWFEVNLPKQAEHKSYLTEIDYVDHFAWIGLNADDHGGIGVARYVRMRDDPTAAEAAIVVVDAYQRRGAGTILLQLLGASALANGITHFVGEALAENQPIRELLENLGARVYDAGAGEVGFEVDLPSNAENVKETAIYRALRAAAEGKVTQVPPESHATEDDAAKVKKHRARAPRP